jgi:1-acyl-sn-glycerol-3-phosphate acyltransferase
MSRSFSENTQNESPQYPWPRRLFVRWLLKAGITFFSSILTRWKVEGAEHVPETGPLIVVINHFHFLDAVMLIRAAPWPLEFLADFDMPNVPAPLKFFPNAYQTYDVAQGTPNLEALRASEAILSQGGVLGIFPEGRVHEPPLRPALPGAAFLALRTGAPLLPVGIHSDYGWKVFNSLIDRGRRLQVTCRFGEVFGPLESGNRRRPSRPEIAMAGQRIMSEIARLLPEPVRGAYPHQDGAG